MMKSLMQAFKISYSLKNTYRVNSIIYSIRQLPLIKKILPVSLYGIRGFKIFANVLSALWEISSAFLGKFLYILLMVTAVSGLYKDAPGADLFVHIFFFLTLIGSYMNTFMFNPTNDKYYAMILMRMDAKSYTLSNYIYSMIKVTAGFLPFTILFGLAKQVPLWICLLLPFFAASSKMLVAWFSLRSYTDTGKCANENLPARIGWTLAAVLLAAAYGLPFLGIIVPYLPIAAVMVLSVAAGIYAAVQIGKFDQYRDMYQTLLSDKKNGTDLTQATRKAAAEQGRRMISADLSITSSKKGFEYFNELFIKRHRKVLWSASVKIAVVSLACVGGLLIACLVNPAFASKANQMLISLVPAFLFIMYAINRGTTYTRALFMNCDHSMLTYSFYRKPSFILHLFWIRLREIVKVNLLPAAVIAGGLTLLLYVSGGTAAPLYYLLVPVSILSMSVFFSVHYLVLYYLLQPFNMYTEVKSATYQIIAMATYWLCYLMLRIRVDTMTFCVLMLVFCILYCIAACVLVYKLAYRTFRIRN